MRLSETHRNKEKRWQEAEGNKGTCLRPCLPRKQIKKTSVKMS